MEKENFVPKGATVVCIKDMKVDFGKVGRIFETKSESKKGGAYYTEGTGMADGYWRYATALELYCFKKHGISFIQQIDNLYKEEFNNYNRNNRKDGNKEENLFRVENARPNGIGQRAITIRKPTKQIAVGIRLIGNQAKGKYLEKRTSSITLKTNAVKF